MAGIDAYTVTMLHMDGADASTTFTDSSLTPKTYTAAGNAQIDTAQSVFGGASGLFDGNGDYISTPDSDDFNFGTGDFTIDFRVRFNSLPSSTNYYYIYNQRVDAGNYVALALYNNAGTYRWFFDVYSGAAQKVNSVRNTTVATGNWYHVALVRTGNDFKFFQDGTQVGATETDADAIPNLAAAVSIGQWSGGGHYLNGWLDEFRISKGIARWTGNFTPPTSEYSVDSTTGFLTTNSKFW
jgi:hypothetical protein